MSRALVLWAFTHCHRRGRTNLQFSYSLHMLLIQQFSQSHVRGIGSLQFNVETEADSHLSLWFRLNFLLLPPTTPHSSNVVPLLIHKLALFLTHRHPDSTFHQTAPDSSPGMAQTPSCRALRQDLHQPGRLCQKLLEGLVCSI